MFIGDFHKKTFLIEEDFGKPLAFVGTKFRDLYLVVVLDSRPKLCFTLCVEM
jgi:hypothetical protein